MSNAPPTPPITEDKFKFNSPCVCENNDYPCLCDDNGPLEDKPIIADTDEQEISAFFADGINVIHPDGRFKTADEIKRELRGVVEGNLCDNCGKNMTEENTRYNNCWTEEDVEIVCVECFGEYFGGEVETKEQE